MKSKISKEQYKDLFCPRVTVSNRYPVCVSGRTHAILKKSVNNMMIWRLSISTLVENIISHHLETYSEQIREIEIEELKKLFGEDEE